MRFGRGREVQPVGWSGTGPKVLIENPDGAVRSAYVEMLQRAGYSVAVCGGPVHDSRPPRASLRDAWAAEDVPEERRTAHVCPITVGGTCAFVEQAEVVVSTTDLEDADAILRALEVRRKPALVVDGAPPAVERTGLAATAIVIPYPVTEEKLLDAVRRALAAR